MWLETVDLVVLDLSRVQFVFVLLPVREPVQIHSFFISILFNEILIQKEKKEKEKRLDVKRDFYPS